MYTCNKWWATLNLDIQQTLLDKNLNNADNIEQGQPRPNGKSKPEAELTSEQAKQIISVLLITLIIN
jgi:hypothetical protein